MTQYTALVSKERKSHAGSVNTFSLIKKGKNLRNSHS